MQKNPQKQNPKKHKFPTHTHTQRYTYISVYTYIHIRISIYNVTCEVHALAKHIHTHTFIHFFSFFFWFKHQARGKKKEQRDRGPQVRARSTKTQLGLPRKVLAGQKILVYFFQVTFPSVIFFAGHFRKQNICRSGHVVLFLLKCLLVLFFLNFIYLFSVTPGDYLMDTHHVSQRK